MNLKERIAIINQLKSTSSVKDIEIKKDVDVYEIFVKNNTVQQLIENSVSRGKNIVFLAPSYCDKTILANYIRNFYDDNASIDLMSNLSENLPYATSQRIIVSDVSVEEMVKIFELILCDYKTFSFCMSLKTFDNVLESFRTLIALSNRNLTASNIEHMLGVSSAVLVYVDRNEDGLYEITNVGKIVYKNNKAFLDVLYSQDKQQENNENLISVQQSATESIVVKTAETDVVDEAQIPIVTETEEETLLHEDVVEEKFEDVVPEEVQENEVVEEQPKKNKYKLLKEKIKSKRMSQE